MSFYTNLQNTATKLLTTYGAQLTFSRTTPGSYDPALGGPSAPTTTTYKGYGAALAYDTKEIDGNNILSDDIKLLVQKTKLAPAVNDNVTVNGEEYVVLGVRETNPAGTVVMNECQVRRGARNVIQQ